MIESTDDSDNDERANDDDDDDSDVVQGLTSLTSISIRQTGLLLPATTDQQHHHHGHHGHRGHHEVDKRSQMFFRDIPTQYLF